MRRLRSLRRSELFRLLSSGFKKTLETLMRNFRERVNEIDRCIARKPMGLPLQNEEIGFHLVASLDAFV